MILSTLILLLLCLSIGRAEDCVLFTNKSTTGFGKPSFSVVAGGVAGLMSGVVIPTSWSMRALRLQLIFVPDRFVAESFDIELRTTANSSDVFIAT